MYSKTCCSGLIMHLVISHDENRTFCRPDDLSSHTSQYQLGDAGTTQCAHNDHIEVLVILDDYLAGEPLSILLVTLTPVFSPSLRT